MCTTFRPLHRVDFLGKNNTHCTVYGSACNGRNVVYKSCFKKYITPVIVFIEVELIYTKRTYVF